MIFNGLSKTKKWCTVRQCKQFFARHSPSTREDIASVQWALHWNKQVKQLQTGTLNFSWLLICKTNHAVNFIEYANKFIFIHLATYQSILSFLSFLLLKIFPIIIYFLLNEWWHEHTLLHLWSLYEFTYTYKPPVKNLFIIGTIINYKACWEC